MDVGIIAVVKNENLYLKEWLDYHLGLGFDKIFLCDNNDGLGELDPFIGDRVEVVNYNSVESVQRQAYTKEFLRLRDSFDWIMFIDIDEYVVLEEDPGIKEFLMHDRFENAQSIRLNWKVFSRGSDLDTSGDYRVFERFKDPFPMNEETFAKSIIRTTINYRSGTLFHGHGYYYRTEAVDVLGKKCLNYWSSSVRFNPIHKVAWVNHYPTKTMGEFIRQKYFRGGSNRNPQRYSTLDYFFKYNSWTQEKEDYGKKLIEEYKIQ